MARKPGSTSAGREQLPIEVERGGARPQGEPGGGAAARSDLRAELRRFVLDHPLGWGHEDWLALLELLRVRGYDVADAENVGRMLERERLAYLLGQVERVGPQRMKVLIDQYGSVWSLRQADVEELARTARLPRPLAERIKTAV